MPNGVRRGLILFFGCRSSLNCFVLPQLFNVTSGLNLTQDWDDHHLPTHLTANGMTSSRRVNTNEIWL